MYPALFSLSHEQIMNCPQDRHCLHSEWHSLSSNEGGPCHHQRRSQRPAGRDKSDRVKRPVSTNVDDTENQIATETGRIIKPCPSGVCGTPPDGPHAIDMTHAAAIKASLLWPAKHLR